MSCIDKNYYVNELNYLLKMLDEQVITPYDPEYGATLKKIKTYTKIILEIEKAENKEKESDFRYKIELIDKVMDHSAKFGGTVFLGFIVKYIADVACDKEKEGVISSKLWDLIKTSLTSLLKFKLF